MEALWRALPSSAVWKEELKWPSPLPLERGKIKGYCVVIRYAVPYMLVVRDIDLAFLN